MDFGSLAKKEKISSYRRMHQCALLRPSSPQSLAPDCCDHSPRHGGFEMVRGLKSRRHHIPMPDSNPVGPRSYPTRTRSRHQATRHGIAPDSTDPSPIRSHVRPNKHARSRLRYFFDAEQCGTSPGVPGSFALADLRGSRRLKQDCLFQGMEQQWSELDDFLEELNTHDDELLHEEDLELKNKKKRLRQDSTAANKRGICYLSRVPPHMDPASLRHILSKYGEIERLYLAPGDPKAQVQRKRTGGFRGKGFSEGWVEFTKKSDAKRIAEMLNGEQIGGRRRSSFYYDIWNIKYLGGLKWEGLSSERAYQNQTRKQKITMEISAAKRERDFYLTKVDRSRALKFIKERTEKKQKTPGPESSGGTAPLQEPNVHKIIHQIPQNRSVADGAAQSKPRLSKDFLAGVFGGSL